MKRSAKVFFKNIFAGTIEQSEDLYVFYYDPNYLTQDLPAISHTLPKRSNSYESKILFPFFDGLIPEGWLLNIATKNWKLDPNDRMNLLLTLCHDCIGAVHIIAQEDNS